MMNSSPPSSIDVGFQCVGVEADTAIGDRSCRSGHEYVTRESMHPADQFEAFKKLAEERGSNSFFRKMKLSGAHHWVCLSKMPFDQCISA
jgi:hypothetical protein